VEVVQVLQLLLRLEQEIHHQQVLLKEMMEELETDLEELEVELLLLVQVELDQFVQLEQ
jgi:hypothetical protein